MERKERERDAADVVACVCWKTMSVAVVVLLVWWMILMSWVWCSAGVLLVAVKHYRYINVTLFVEASFHHYYIIGVVVPLDKGLCMYRHSIGWKWRISGNKSDNITKQKHLDLPLHWFSMNFCADAWIWHLSRGTKNRTPRKKQKKQLVLIWHRFGIDLASI